MAALPEISAKWSKPRDLTGENVLITGASGGLGLAVAKQVAETREKLKKGLKSPLESLLKEGKLNASEKSASLKDPALKDFIITMKLENNKWYMENNKK